jgi:cation:H+ antiporter
MLLPFVVLITCFVILFKCANYVVDGAVSIAHITRIPKFVVGLILVSLATTTPELAVSVIAAFFKHPEISLGNALGSVICDDALALGFAALIAPVPILVNPVLLKKTAFFLIAVDILAYLLILNGTIGRLEGLLLLLILFCYYFYTYHREKKRRRELREGASPNAGSIKKAVLLFITGIIGVIIASRGVVWSSVELAKLFGISTTIIGLTVIAIGTSLPEISTCLVAARRGEGEIAVGDILGADILNILWIIGMSSLVNPIAVDRKVINFAFPWMIVIVFVTLIFLRHRYSMGKVKGGILFALYVVYLVWTVVKFYPSA